MKLSSTDCDLLELLVLEVPWNLVCADFHEQYGSPAELAKRLMWLQHAELISARPVPPEPSLPTAVTLLADAIANDCHDSLNNDHVRWMLVTTDRGYAVAQRGLTAE